jgi:pantetheine-phosphate adenylyltransferase
MARALYPGTFDPITLGHLDVIKEAARIFEEVIVAILVNPQKSPLFTAEERKSLIESVTKDLSNVRVIISTEAAVSVAKENKADTLIRGLRLNTDFEQELFLAMNNRELDKEIQTVFFPPKQNHIHISSTAVREILKLKPVNLKEVLTAYIPAEIVKNILEKE